MRTAWASPPCSCRVAGLDGGSLDGPLYDFLQEAGLASLGWPLRASATSLEACVHAVTHDRTAFLSTLRDKGVTKLADRQALANALAKALRAGWLQPPYTGPFTAAGRELRHAREAQPSAAASQPVGRRPPGVGPPAAAGGGKAWGGGGRGLVPGGLAGGHLEPSPASVVPPRGW